MTAVIRPCCPIFGRGGSFGCKTFSAPTAVAPGLEKRHVKAACRHRLGPHLCKIHPKPRLARLQPPCPAPTPVPINDERFWSRTCTCREHFDSPPRAMNATSGRDFCSWHGTFPAAHSLNPAIALSGLPPVSTRLPEIITQIQI
jgi:hypothetical protein